MIYAIVPGEPGTQGKAYHFFKYKARTSAQKNAGSDEFSLVFESAEELQQLRPTEDLKGILTSSGVDVPETATESQIANALFLLVSENATWPAQKEEATQTEEPEMATAKKTKSKKAPAEKKAKAPKKVIQAKTSGRMAKTGKIKKLGVPNPARQGTKRYENLEVVLGSKTVESALETLRNMTPPGGMLDIRFAIESGLIEVTNND